jgi:putative polyhydroxyalkanoate system protein
MAKTLTVSIPHNVTREEAKRRVIAGVASHKAKFAKMAQVEDKWTGDTMDFKATAMGQSLTGRAEVTDSSVVINVDLPFMLAMMSGRIKGEIESEGRKMLEQK